MIKATIELSSKMCAMEIELECPLIVLMASANMRLTETSLLLVEEENQNTRILSQRQGLHVY